MRPRSQDRQDGRRARHCGRLRYRLALVVPIFATLLGLPSLAAPQEPPARQGEAIILDLDGAVGPATAEYLHQGLATAAERHAGAVILRMDTPGGLSTAMRRIIRDILASPVPVIGYVAPSGSRAASAGTYILYATHLAAMAPGTNLGAATPISIGGGLFGGGGSEKSKQTKSSKGKQQPESTETRKVVNDAVAYIRGLAELRGRNAEWAEQAVREAASLPANDALAKNVINLIATSPRDLLNKADGRTVSVRGQQRTLQTAGLAISEIAPDWRARLLGVITDPNIAYLLLLAGIYGLLFEFINPGAIAPGVLGAIALLVGLYALNLIPINYAGVGLVLLGVALMVMEHFLPSFGIAGFGGIASFAIGSIMMFDTEVPGFGISWWTVGIATAASAGFLLLLLGFVWRAHRRPPVSGEPAVVGQVGRVEAWQGETGQVHVHGESWQARSAAALQVGQNVRVVARKDLALIVEPLPSPPPQS